MKNSHFLVGLIFVFLIALSTRFLLLTKFPVSLTLDEVEIGYNAYSLLHTGKDAWNVPLPLVFYSVGDYKPPVNVYLSVLPISLLGLTELAVRIPSALMGAFSIIFLVLVLRRLGFSKFAALFSGFWFAVLPWHIHFSRAGFEAVTALCFTLAALATFFSSLSSRRHTTLALTLVLFSLGVWAYHSTRLFIPLLVIFLFLTYRHRLSWVLKLKTQTKLILVGVFLLFALPFIYLSLFTPAIRTRAQATSILREASLLRVLHQGNFSHFSERLFDPDIFLIFHHWLGKYINYFDLRFWFYKGLFFTPDGYPDTGLLYLIDLPLIFLGFYALIKSRLRSAVLLAVFWFFVGPLAASFAQNDQHALRSLTWSPFFALAVAAAADLLAHFSLKRRLLALFVYLLLLGANIVYVTDLYTLQLPRFNSEFWQYGFKDIALYACAHQSEYDSIIISETFGSLGPLLSGIPYSYVLFYCQYPPAEFQAGQDIPKFIFRRVNWEMDRLDPHSLLISAPWDYPDSQPPASQVINQINFLNGLPGFYFVDTSKK